MQYSAARKQVELLAKNADVSDIDWLFCSVLNIGRASLAGIKQITKSQFSTCKKYAKKLAKGKPLSQILGYTEFCGNKILVNSKVLTPRPETEELTAMLINAIKADTNLKDIKVLDLCCGSGAIAVAVAKSTTAQVTAVDISKDALTVTRKNAKLNKVNIKTICSDMLNKVWGHYNYIICNPPYIAADDPRVDKNVKKYEPKIALFAAENEYAYYTYLANYVGAYILKGGKLLLEVGDGMAETVAGKFKDFADIQIKADMQGKNRFVIVTK